MAIVFGASGAVGAVVATHLFDLGFDLVVLARRASRLDELRSRLLATTTRSSSTESLYAAELHWRGLSSEAVGF